jgi:hypothetical protein
MAKRRTKVLQARKSDASRDDDSLLIRSAESLGKVIGSLQRQVQGTTKRMSTVAEDAMDALPALPRMDKVVRSARQMIGQGKGSRKARGRKTTGTRKGSKKGAAGRRTSARKTSGARKASGSRKRASSARKGRS